MRSVVEKIRCDAINIYIVHWPDPKTPIQETMKVLNHLK
ncbi:aldo/keto reductase [Enterococcus sp. S181_ASV_20]|nr:aldo/keto reductase [Enterococcus sp. S181_ASV_20]